MSNGNSLVAVTGCKNGKRSVEVGPIEHTQEKVHILLSEFSTRTLI